jgi:hypothetical protein
MISCLQILRRVARVSLCVLSPFAFAATKPVFPVLTYEPYAVSSPLAMAEGDLNGDGIVDTLYASASSTAGSSVLTASPHSTTGTALTPIAAGTVPCTANSILLADLNKDSKLDAVVTCNEGTVAVLAGNGDGTFAAATTYPVASSAKAITADLNADGYPDLAVAMNTHNTTSNFAVLVNTGKAGPLAFATPQIYGGSYGSRQILAGDLNNDGKLDIVAGGDPDQVTGFVPVVFAGNGDGTFKSTTNPYNLVMGPNVVLADFDGDGKIDLATPRSNGTTVVSNVFLSFPNTSKDFTAIPIAPGITRIQAVDLNNDGHPDIVLSGSTTTLILNDGTGKLSVGRSYATPGSFYIARKGAAGIDLVFSTTRGFYTLHGNGKGGFDGLPAFLNPTLPAAFVGDINSDGLSDIFSPNSGLGRGDGTFVSSGTGLGQPITIPLLADFTGDGIVDRGIVTPNNSSMQNESTLYTLRVGSDGQSSFLLSDPLDLGVKNVYSAITGDFNGDGKQDVVVAYPDSSGTSIGLLLVPGKGDGTFRAPTAIGSSTTSLKATPVSVDLNGDGKPDLLWASSAYVNRGDGTFTALTLPVQGTALAAGDLDGDGVADAIIDNAIYAGKGDGTFLPTPLFTIATPASATLISACIGDLSGDGHHDILVQSFSDMVVLTVTYSDGQGNFTTDDNTYTTGSNPHSSGSFARLNNSAPALPGDNRLDYIVFSDGAAISLLNQTNPTPGPLAPLPTSLRLSVGLQSVYPLQPELLMATLTGINAAGTMTYTLSDGTVLGKATVTPGFAETGLQPAFPTPGTYTITATYSGDSINAPSTSNPVTVAVAKFVTKTQINMSVGGYVNRTSTISAIVDSYQPTASVVFSSGDTTLGSAPVLGGIATLRYKFTSLGTYPVVATFPGDASNLPSVSSAVSMVMAQGPDFSISVTPTTNTVKAGDTATYTISVTSIRNYSGYVTMGCQPTCTTAQLYVAPGQPSTIQFSLKTNAPGATGPYLRYGPIAGALLLFSLRRKRWKHSMPRLDLGLLIACLSLGLLSVSGCSSGKDSSSPSGSDSGTGTTYNFVVTATDSGMEASHSVNLTLIVK